ncbi:tumor necrosis factor receptor superfamily member 25 [Trichomycterus rosablanca]|uniref:tumor necrosis factor receptor superfamily member 25 n=1 Tax=Trichomycterus rosablanca TaxID=2290929 RepID=UPI002F35F693
MDVEFSGPKMKMTIQNANICYYKFCTKKGTIFCDQCGDEEYADVKHSLQHCQPCRRCDTVETEIVKSECTPLNNRECSCKDGFYLDHSSPALSCKNCGKCENCTKCPTCINCGACKGGQFLDQKGNCRSCLENYCLDKSCHPFCKRVHPPSSTWLVVFVIILTVLLLLGLRLLPFICKACKKRQFCCWGQKKENINVGQNEVPLNPPTLPVVSNYSNSVMLHLYRYNPMGILKNQMYRIEVEKETWPSAVLYAIIKQVPVRRWKEFLRLLSVSDDQMERVEMEEKLYSEQQYMMLRLWSQKSDANLENIYSTLHYMDLSGCIEELKEKIQELEETHLV